MPEFGVPEYTALTVLAVAAVAVLELFVLRTGLFRTVQYWISIAIVVFFQVLVDGWLTKLSDPIVLEASMFASFVTALIYAPVSFSNDGA